MAPFLLLLLLSGAPKPLALSVNPQVGRTPLVVHIQPRVAQDDTYRLLVLQSYCGAEEYPDNEKVVQTGYPIPMVTWTLRCSEQSVIHGFVVDQAGKKVKGSIVDVTVLTY